MSDYKQQAEGWHPSDPHLFTYSGERVYLFRPTAAMIHLADIAQALSQICRYGGHTRSHYSVAEHSVLVSEKFKGEMAFAALLHDAAEAYLGDVISPLKALLLDYEKIYDKFDDAIAEKFGVDYRLGWYEDIKKADAQVGIMERNCRLISLRPSVHSYLCPIRMLSAVEAKNDFLLRFASLTGNASRY